MKFKLDELEAEAETAGDVVDRWERIKTGREEKESRLSGVPMTW